MQTQARRSLDRASERAAVRRGTAGLDRPSAGRGNPDGLTEASMPVQHAPERRPNATRHRAWRGVTARPGRGCGRHRCRQSSAGHPSARAGLTSGSSCRRSSATASSSSFPTIRAFYLSFFDWSGYRADRRFHRARNFRDLLSSGRFWSAAKNSAQLFLCHLRLPEHDLARAGADAQSPVAHDPCLPGHHLPAA